MSPSWCRAVALGVAMTLSLPAVAQEPDTPHTPVREATKEELAAARKLFNDAKDLEADGKWSKAFELLERVAKVKTTPQVRFHLALCHENLGRWVDAINGYEQAAQEALKMGKKAREVAEAAPPRAEKLREKVPHLRLAIVGSVRTSKVLIDGNEVSLALAGSPIPIDPGEHRIEVRRDGEVTQTLDVTLEEAETADVELRIHDPEPPPPPKPDVWPEPPPPPPPPPPEEGPGQWPAYVVAGAGAAGIVVGGVLFGLRNQRIGEVRCDDGFTGCNPDDEPIVDEARRFDIGSKVGFGVGAGLLATGVVLWFVLWEPKDEPGGAVSLAPFADGGAQLRIRF